MAREIDMVDAFVYLADTLVTGYDVDDFLHSLTERATDVLGAAAAGVLLSDRDGELRLLAASTHAMRTLEVFEVQSAEGPCVDAYRTGAQVVAPDFADEERWPRLIARAVDAGFSSALAVPLRLRDERIGALNVFSYKADAFDDQSLRVAQGIADVAAIGILQEREVTRARERVTQLQGALDSRVLIEQAKGVLRERWDVTADEAFDHLRGYARGHHVTLREVCTRVLDGWTPPAD